MSFEGRLSKIMTHHDPNWSIWEKQPKRIISALVLWITWYYWVILSFPNKQLLWGNHDSYGWSPGPRSRGRVRRHLLSKEAGSLGDPDRRTAEPWRSILGKVLAREAQGTTAAFMTEPKWLIIKVLSRRKGPWAALVLSPFLLKNLLRLSSDQRKVLFGAWHEHSGFRPNFPIPQPQAKDTDEKRSVVRGTQWPQREKWQQPVFKRFFFTTIMCLP